MSLRISLIVFCLVLVFTGCATKRTNPSPQRTLPLEDTELVSASAVDQPQIPSPEDQAKTVQSLIENSRLDFEEGRKLFTEGRTEEARRIFRDVLEGLEQSAAAFSKFPELEATYHTLLQESQDLEVAALVDPADLQVLSPTGSPLDEIGDLDLVDVQVDPTVESLVYEDLRQHELFFPMELKDVVLQFVDFYQGRRGRRIMEKGLRVSGRYINMFRQVFREAGVPEELVYMAQVESLFNPRATSRARAKGIWQFMSGTARIYGLEVGWWLDERMDVEKSTRAAARHLSDLYEEFQDWPLVLAGYNAGPGRVRRNLRRYGQMDFWTMAERKLLPRETRNHVPSILAAILIFRDPERYGFKVEPDPELTFDRVSVEYQVDLKVLAEELAVPVDELRDLNPELARDVTPLQDKPFSLRVPPGRAEELEKILAELPEEKRLKWAHYKVRQGDTLSEIADGYGISMRALAETNRIRNVNRLKLGQDLIIPLSGSRRYSGKRRSAPSVKSSTGSHVVRRGDSLYKIAILYGVTVEDLSRWNAIKPTQVIHPGQTIKVRGSDQSDSRRQE